MGVSLFCWGPRDGLLKVPNLENANKIKRRERQIVRCCLLGRAATYSCYRISLYPRLFSFLFISDKGVSLATRCWKQPWNVVERLDVAPVLFFFYENAGPITVFLISFPFLNNMPPPSPVSYVQLLYQADR